MGILTRNTRWSIKRGIRVRDGRAILAKTPSDWPCPNEQIAALERELHLGRKLASTDDEPLWILDSKGIPTLLMPDHGGMPLSRCPKMEGEDFLHFALALIRAVASLHHKGFAHRAIYKDSILYNVDRQNATLLNLSGMVNRFTKNLQPGQPGTLEMRPDELPLEELGFCDTPPGFHSDLYALGRIFYELLTGRPYPDAVTMLKNNRNNIRNHLSAKPDFAPILEGLLAPLPQDRYLSVKDLEQDILNAAGTTKTSREPHASSLEHDPYLSTIVERVRTGRVECVLIKDLANHGVTSPFGRILPLLANASFLCVRATCGPETRLKPFQLCFNLLDSIFTTMARADHSLQDNWRHRLINIVGNNQEIRFHIPKLSAFLGDLKHGGAQTGDQMSQILVNIFSLVRRHERPLALLLQGLEDIDPDSLHVLRLFLAMPGQTGLLFMGGRYELGTAWDDPLMSAFHQVRKEITITRLNNDREDRPPPSTDRPGQYRFSCRIVGPQLLTGPARPDQWPQSGSGLAEAPPLFQRRSSFSRVQMLYLGGGNDASSAHLKSHHIC